jgi:hypothetical protein
MKPGLQRIEATLNQLYAHSPRQVATSFQIIPSRQKSSQELTFQASSTQVYSFQVRPASSSPTYKAVNDQKKETVTPFPIQTPRVHRLTLPKSKRPTFSNHRHAANPGLALSLLKEMEGIATGWQAELQKILLQIQEIYLEGPIVDGWLESNTHESDLLPHLEQKLESLTAKFPEATAPINASINGDNGEGDRPQASVQLPAQEADAARPEPDATVQQPLPRAEYRLCGLDAAGQPWSRACPPEQVPYVGLAIARYQKLRQLLARKHDLESRLSRFAHDLIGIHSKLH